MDTVTGADMAIAMDRLGGIGVIGRFDAPEAPGLDALMCGLSMVRDDHDVLAVSATLYDGLYAYRQRTVVS